MCGNRAGVWCEVVSGGVYVVGWHWVWHAGW